MRIFRCLLAGIVLVTTAGALLAGELVDVSLVPDGSADPPGDRIDVSLMLEAGDSAAKLQVRALLVTPDTEEGVTRIKAREGSNNRDVAGNFELSQLVGKPPPAYGQPGVALTIPVVIPYKDLAIEPGDYKLGYEVRLLAGGKVAATMPTRVTELTVTDQTREQMEVLETVKREEMETRVRPATVIRNGEVREETFDETVTVERSEVQPKTHDVSIPGEFLRSEGGIRAFSVTEAPTVAPDAAAAVPSNTFVAEPRRRIYFATNRKYLPHEETANERFPAERIEPTEPVTWGNCLVSIPIHHHKEGRLETPPRNWWTTPDPTKHFLIEAVATFPSRRDFEASLGPNDVLLYIHGYNNSFSDAVLRTAQLQHDLQFPGKSIAFCWPSAGKGIFRRDLFDFETNDARLAYQHDKAQAENSYKRLSGVLQSLINLPPPASGPPRKIHVIAHSMGNRLLSLAIQDLKARGQLPPENKPFSNIILVAADLEGSTFASVLPTIVGATERLSFYYSKDDLALLLSQGLATNRPIGLDPVFNEGMDTICADGANSRYFGGGHLYLGASPGILHDLRLLINNRHPPDKRLPPLLEKRPAGNLEGYFFWVFAP